MGQGASQPERATESSSRQNRRRSMLRQSIRHSTIGLDEGQRGLLHGEHSGARSRPRPRPTSTSRLSQLLHSPARLDGGAEQVEHAARPALLQRTRSTLQNMLTRRESTHVRHSVMSRPAHGLLQHRTSYVRADMGREGNEHYLPRLPSIDHSPTFDHDTFASQDEPEASPPRSSSSNRRPNLRFDSLRPSRPFRHFTSSLRRRRSPLPSSSVRRAGSEDQAAMLSRLLSVAAAATAATLMGDDHQALSDARSLTGGTGVGDLGAGGEDGSFDGFLRALQNGRIASALRQGNDTDGDSATRESSLNFFRMFRFGASGSNSTTFPETRASSGMGDPSEVGENNDGRMVPIIIVGIRSISPSSNAATGAGADELPPFIDALGNFPSPLPAHTLGTHGHDSIDSILRPPQNGTSFRHRRRASMGAFGMGRSRISDRLDDQRDHRSPDRRRERPWSMASSSSNSEPRAPMPTPASPSPELSRISSRNSTPSHSRPASFVANSVRDFGSDSRRNSVLHRAPATSPLTSHTEETASLHSTHSGTNLLSSNDDPGVFRFHSHRRSDTVPNIHYPRFASGHPRRNGVVEPDNLPSLSRTSTTNEEDNLNANNEGRRGSNDSRSWIIYVLGGSYPENHPILTTPSLFTENPTYEDMMLLSALLGPAKAPVASEEDVQSAGGLFNIRVAESPQNEAEADAAKSMALVADAVDGSEQVDLEPLQRCLVCLCEFEKDDLGRKLVKCDHLFHKECIDQWLTQGRNSCPLCRGQGVDEKEKKDEPTTAASTEATTPTDEAHTTVGAEARPAELEASSSS